MQQTTARAVRDASKYIHENYEFMLERGYEVLSIEDIDLGWQAVLRRADLYVKILRTRGDEYVSFRPGTQPPDGFIDIGSVVYAATGEKMPLSYGTYSRELHQYLGQIEAYFEGEYVTNGDSLRAAEKEYRETLPQVEVPYPKEQKIIPIFHYPLMGVIMLLLFGALTTLYMVLLERLLSGFSLETGSYGIFVGIVALFFAAGTLLLIWRGRKKS